jgi:hypothetical protein
MVMKFAKYIVREWNEFLDRIKGFSNDQDKWVYRGHTKDHALSTSLERAREYFDVKWSDLPGLEEQLIRNFRRRFQGEKDEDLFNDTLYCPSLMQHHGAPTRLLDFTFSAYVGALFAIESSENPSYEEKGAPVLLCVRIE